MGTLLHSCVEVRKPIELSLGDEWGRWRMGVLVRGSLGFLPHWFEWRFLLIFKTNLIDSCVKSSQYYRQCIIGIGVSLAF